MNPRRDHHLHGTERTGNIVPRVIEDIWHRYAARVCAGYNPEARRAACNRCGETGWLIAHQQRRSPVSSAIEWQATAYGCSCQRAKSWSDRLDASIPEYCGMTQAELDAVRDRADGWDADGEFRAWGRVLAAKALEIADREKVTA